RRVAGRVQAQRPAAGTPVVHGPGVVGQIPVELMVVEQLERAELEGAGPVDVAIPVVTPKQGPAQLRVAEDFTGLGPVVAAADVHVDDAGAPQEPEVVDVGGGYDWTKQIGRAHV